MKYIYFLNFLLFSLLISSQNIKIFKLDSLAKSNERIDKLEKHNTDFKISFEEFKVGNEKRITEIKEDTKSLINFYIFGIIAFLGLIGFLINFLGKKAIKDRVEEIISEIAESKSELKIVEVLNSKLTDELIERTIKTKAETEIKNIIKSLEEKGNFTINEIKEKGNDAINALKTQSTEKIDELQKDSLTDAEINSQNDKQTADELFDLAYNSNDPRLQIELYKNVLELEPKNSSALNNISVAYNALTRPEESIKNSTKALEIKPDYFQALSNRAQAYNLLGEFEKGLIDIEKSIELNPHFEYSYSVKGNILTKLSKFEEAEKELNKAIELNPNSGDAYFNRAYFYEERKEFRKSENDYKKAEELGVINKAMLYNNLAVLYRRMKKFELAIEYLDKARKLSPDFANIDGTLALIYADKGDDTNFYKHLKIALDKGCKAWEYLRDPGFDKYRESTKLKALIESYRKKYFA